ncbi:hypothetical protein RvY_06492 [Ramazzottius varieornatus]|uniref:Protein quiver n=1 Tax=Ramazzottius varieornatus TaxID=947166 RepID=A0A1D1V7G8_RAMVA|nr:hypothetical protein RvY_06492 [Ramazzottius varieornatus]
MAFGISYRSALAFLILTSVMVYASALNCYMCNGMAMHGMPGKYSDCTNKTAYHSMGCPASTSRCLMLKGHHSVLNKTTNSFDSNFNGTVRDCMSPNNTALYFPTSQFPNGAPTKDGCYNHMVFNQPSAGNGSLSFNGTLCLCSEKECNAAYRTELSAVFFLTLAMAVFSALNR